MSDLTDLPDPTALPGVPHPRDTGLLIGQDAAERAFLDAYGSGRLHHAWMITGPKGIGKATLAYRIARFLLATPPMEEDGLFGAPEPPTTLNIDPDHPVARRMAAGSDPGLFVVKRSANDKGDRISAEIRIDDVRKLKSFFALSSADGGRRVVIVDAADEMNTNAANALLKLLEEPPSGAFLLLIAHQPSRLLPTIRSRCRVLSCAPLAPDDLTQALRNAEVTITDAGALGALAAGSVGAAVRLETQDGVQLYGALVALFSGLPSVDRQLALKLSETVAGRAGADRLTLLLDLLDLFLARLARTGAGHAPTPEAVPGEAEVMRRLAPDAHAARGWANLAQSLGNRARQGQAVNLDPSALLLDIVLKIEEQARETLPA
ncbi:MAG: DNA polymerase III subunit delta' [Pseudomonadota bacterium]